MLFIDEEKNNRQQGSAARKDLSREAFMSVLTLNEDDESINLTHNQWNGIWSTHTVLPRGIKVSGKLRWRKLKKKRKKKNDASQIDVSANGRKNRASEDKSEQRSTFSKCHVAAIHLAPRAPGGCCDGSSHLPSNYHPRWQLLGTLPAKFQTLTTAYTEQNKKGDGRGGMCHLANISDRYTLWWSLIHDYKLREQIEIESKRDVVLW